MVAEGTNKPLLFQRQGFGVECKYIEDPRRGFGRIVNMTPPPKNGYI